MLAIVDLKISNIQSVINSLNKVGLKGEVTTDQDKISQAKAIILPGVGAFAKGIASIRSYGLLDILRKRALVDKVPFLGICLGMQLLANCSEEGGMNEGLGLINGKVIRLSPDQEGFLVPNISWYPVSSKKNSILHSSLDGESFYFVHSYHLVPDNSEDIAGNIEYSGKNICATVEHGNILGVQFHPEKSQDAGLDLLNNFKLFLEKKGAI